MKQEQLFGTLRMQMDEAIALTTAALLTHGRNHRRWAIAYSGGKDSTLLLVLTLWLIQEGRVPPPEELVVLYADTRMELPPLAIAAALLRAELGAIAEDFERLGCKLSARVVLPPLDDRFFVYLLGRGVPPPSNRFRWCTEKIKVKPMAAELERLAGERRDKILMLTGLRIGESAARDERIALACGRDGGECGQGWFQETLSSDLVDTLAPILHWRVCHVWAYLRHHAPAQGFDTILLAEAYGGDEAEEENARTGCSGCPVAAEDHTLARICRMPGWSYLTPLKRLRPYYWNTLRASFSRLRMPYRQPEPDLAPALLVKREQHARRRAGQLGPLTFEARRAGLAFILGVQAEVNEAAARLSRPVIDILNAEEAARIEALIEAQTWPGEWEGTEPNGVELADQVFLDGTVQPLLPGLKG